MTRLSAVHILSIAGLLLLMVGMVKVVVKRHRSSETKSIAVKSSQSRQRFPSPFLSAKEANNISRILVFRCEGERRKYVGCLGKDSPHYQALLKAIETGIPVKSSGLAHADYEIFLLGRGFYRRARFNSQDSIMAIETLGREGVKLELILRLTNSISPPLAKARPRKPPKNFRPRESMAQLPPPPPLERVVRESSIILIGTPIDIIANEYEVPGGPEQHTVYALQVERYLKDETGLNSPIVLLTHYGGYLGDGEQWAHDPLPQIGARYIFFLVKPFHEFVWYTTRSGKIVVRRYYPGEWSHFPEALLLNGRTEPVRKDVDWLKGREDEIITKITAAINQEAR